MSHPPKKSTINNDGMNSAGSWGQPLDFVVGASAATASTITNVKNPAAIHALAVMTPTVGELVEYPGPGARRGRSGAGLGAFTTVEARSQDR